MNQLVGKNVVITGASSGIGEKLAWKVAEMGGRPILLARSSNKLAEICKTLNQKTSVNGLFFPLDVSDFAQVKVVFQKIDQEAGQVDILVNSAGFGVFDTFLEAKFEDIEKMFKVNVLGLIACTKEVLPSMMERNTGHIIHIASQAGKIATPKSSGYAASKHAVLGLTNSLRMELSNTNIFVSAVNPGPVETNFFTVADQSGNYVKNVKKYMLKSDYVAEKIIQLMLNPRRELNLPGWMNMGSVLYNLFPSAAEKLTRRLFDKK